MEYFDFEQAARDDDVASTCQELGDAESLVINDDNQPDTTEPVGRPNGLVNNANTSHDSAPELDPAYPMYRAEEPCFFCRSMGLDCVVAQRGVMQQSGCTCCISLYRECSFTRAQPQGKFINTLHVVGEDAYVPTGGLTGKKALRSFSGPVIQEDTESKSKKAGARFSREAVRVLRLWLSQHSAHPYPTDEEKTALKQKTGLKKNQISNWLANARRRGKVRPQTELSAEGIPIPGKALPPGVDMSELTPLERWRHSPPENEPASPRDIIQAMARTGLSPEKEKSRSGHVRSNSRRTGSRSSNPDSSSNLRQPKSSSDHSWNTSKSSLSDMSFASAFSHRSSRASHKSADTRERRRRRHKAAAASSNPLQKGRDSRPFQCTFCTESFSTKYDWQRHEKSLHIALDKWTCAPQGGVMLEGGEQLCVFCRHSNPDVDHLETHNYGACQEKSIHERTFYRKDHLNQHLRLMHNTKLGSWMDPWRSTVTEIKSRCGFCSTVFSTWKDRADHLAAHFKAGTEMSQWKGDWGFEPHVHKIIENAVPPYLIGHEKETLDPFVAVDPAKRKKTAARDPVVSASCASSAGMPVPSDENCFRRLEIELSAFVGRMTAQGIVPSDSAMQAEARRVIYGCDDPWNQTCADNPTWLAILKRNTGVCELPDAHDIQLGDIGMQPPFAANGGLHQTPMHSLGAPATGPALSPTYPSTGMHSAAPSIHESLASSLAGSSDPMYGFSAAPLLLNSNRTTPLSSSAPVTTTVDPITKSAYDAEFIPQLNDEFGNLRHDFNDMQLDGLVDPGGIMDLDHSGFSTKNPPRVGGPSSSLSAAPPPPTRDRPTVLGSFDPSYHAMFDPSRGTPQDNGFGSDAFHFQYE